MEIGEILAGWDVSEDTIEAFRKNNIDATCLEGLGDEELKILIPETRLRDRIKFKIGYTRYKEDIVTVHSNTTSLDTISLSSFSDLSSETSKAEYELDIENILKTSTQGCQALQAIKRKKMDNASRSNLVQAIVEYYLKTYKKMTKMDFQAISNEIVRLCPTECKETYYVPSRTIGLKNTVPAKGKLVDRYYNQIRTLRTSGILPKRPKHTLVETDTADIDDSDDEENMKWLKFNRDPWPLVEQKWQDTCSYRKRKSYDSNTNLKTIFNYWTCLKTACGHRLLEIDFCHIFKEKQYCLINIWEDFRKNAIKLMEQDLSIGNDIKEMLKADNENVRDFAVCSALPLKMKPTSKIMNIEKKKVIKVSTAESRQAFVTHVNNYADVEEELHNRHKSYNKKGLTCQPFIIVVGLYEFFYVIIDDVKYKFDSMTKALDICFKTFMVLNLAYPKECEQIWRFIQQYFYEIELATDKKFGQVSNFIKELQE